jgi:hypothetical protein
MIQDRIIIVVHKLILHVQFGNNVQCYLVMLVSV